MLRLQTPKGFRDFLPKDAIARQFVMATMRTVLERFGFDPLETPSVEYAETLLGKYGEEGDKLLFLFEDNAGRKIGLPYDRTVPLARVISQYQNELPNPWKRYQIQSSFRAENTQKGRYREFVQCDLDIVGVDSAVSDAEIIGCSLAIARALGFKKTQMLINDRTIFDSLGLTPKDVIIVDKLEKIGKQGVVTQLKEKNNRANAQELVESLQWSAPTKRLGEIMQALRAMGFSEGKDFTFAPTLARGLDYYTSTVFEMKVPDSGSSLSIAGGGRWDKMIGQFSGKNIPAVGIALGLDRIVEVLTDLKLLATSKTTTQVFVTIFDQSLTSQSLAVATMLRQNNITVDVWPDNQYKLEKQLKYADKKGIPYVVIQGPDEAAKNMVQLKNMKTRTSKTIKINELIEALKNS